MAVMLLAGCTEQDTAGTQPTTAPPVTQPSTAPTTHPVLSAADFDQIEAGMLLTEVIEILGYRGKFVASEGYVYTTSENIVFRLSCIADNPQLPYWDSNLIVSFIHAEYPDGTSELLDSLYLHERA